MWSAFPTSDYYEDSVPRTAPRQAMRLPCQSEGDAVAVPTFTDLRLTGAVPSYTPAASSRAIAVSRATSATPSVCNLAEWECDRLAALPLLHPTQIHQVRVGRRIKGPQSLVHVRYTFPSC